MTVVPAISTTTGARYAAAARPRPPRAASHLKPRVEDPIDQKARENREQSKFNQKSKISSVMVEGDGTRSLRRRPQVAGHLDCFKDYRSAEQGTNRTDSASRTPRPVIVNAARWTWSARATERVIS